MPADRRGNIALPFFHLRSEGFWHLMPQPGQESIVPAIRHADSLSRLRKLVVGASLDQELFQLLQDSSARQILREVLIETYFGPGVRLGLYQQAETNLDVFRYSQELLAHPSGITRESLLSPTLVLPVRSEGFRRAVRVVYDRRCALCGIRVITAEGYTVVDASHIVPWSLTHDDRVNNGLALCRLCHWCFDQGLISISQSYDVVTSRELTVTLNVPGHLSALDRRPMIRPVDSVFWPDLESLTWHRHEVFRKR